MKKIELNGRIFEAREKYRDFKGETVEQYFNPRYTYNDIFDAYDRPSQAKIEIWNDWERWAREQGFSVWIESRNCFMFTIGFVGYIHETDETITEYRGIITPSHNKVVIIREQVG